MWRRIARKFSFVKIPIIGHGANVFLFSYSEKQFFLPKGYGQFGQGVNTLFSVSLSPENVLKFIPKTVQTGVFFQTKLIFYYHCYVLISYVLYLPSLDLK